MATLLQLRKRWAKQDTDQRAQECAEIERQLKTWGIQNQRDGWRVLRCEESQSVLVANDDLPRGTTLKLNHFCWYGIRGCPIVVLTPDGHEGRWINSARDLVRAMEGELQ